MSNASFHATNKYSVNVRRIFETNYFFKAQIPVCIEWNVAFPHFSHLSAAGRNCSVSEVSTLQSDLLR